MVLPGHKQLFSEIASLGVSIRVLNTAIFLRFASFARIDIAKNPSSVDGHQSRTAQLHHLSFVLMFGRARCIVQKAVRHDVLH